MKMAEIESMKLLMICLVSSFNLVQAKEMQEQYRATQAHHLKIKIILKRQWYSMDKKLAK